jgi:ethanolamine ammonia-lyase small subunit
MNAAKKNGAPDARRPTPGEERSASESSFLYPLFAASAAADPWSDLRRFTAARIALGRTGGSQRTASVLDFRLAQAKARDAVYTPFDPAALIRELAAHTLTTHVLHTAVSDRTTYLAHPDFGRQLDEASRTALRAHASQWGRRSLAVIVSDGLSAQAAHRHAVATIAPLFARLSAKGWTFYPVFLVPFGRVKLQDEIGELLGARHTLMLLGERPGLDSPDSLGAYFTHTPRAACRDADRNCVSNIRPEGLPPAAAAEKLAHLLDLSARLGTSGVALKDTQNSDGLPAATPASTRLA